MPAGGYGQLCRFQKLADLETSFVALAADPAGEVYILTNENLGRFGPTGKFLRLIP